MDNIIGIIIAISLPVLFLIFGFMAIKTRKLRNKPGQGAEVVLQGKFVQFLGVIMFIIGLYFLFNLLTWFINYLMK